MSEVTDQTRLIKALGLLGDPTRFLMFKTVCENSQHCVSDLALILGVSPSAVSQHFQGFEMLGIMQRKRTGQKICYQSTHDDLANQLCQLTHKHFA